MDSPDQGAFGFKADSAALDKESMKFTVKSIGGEFEGKIEPPATRPSASGSRGALVPADAQEGRRGHRGPPAPGAEAAVPLRLGGGRLRQPGRGVRIAGTLTVPEGDGPFPAALLITGSGPQDRDETLLGHKPFLVLADDLTRRGIAVLRVDDRGVGGSTGDHAKATTADFAEDVLGGVDFLKARRRIDPKRIGLIGHSEGGLIAPMVAARSADVAFIVLMAGPGLPGDEILEAQQALILKAIGRRRGEDPPGRPRRRPGSWRSPRRPSDPKVAREKLQAAGAEMAAALPEAERKALAEADPNGSQVGRLATPWFRYFLTYDPRPTLARVRCPVLAINGEKDLQVPARRTSRPSPRPSGRAATPA